MTRMKTREQGKWGPQLIYSFSSYNEKPGVWMAVILSSLYHPKAEELHCKDGLLGHLGLYWITTAFKNYFWCYGVFCPFWLVIHFLTCDNFCFIHCVI